MDGAVDTNVLDTALQNAHRGVLLIENLDKECLYIEYVDSSGKFVSAQIATTATCLPLLESIFHNKGITVDVAMENS
jgi:hypothetical protein